MKKAIYHFLKAKGPISFFPFWGEVKNYSFPLFKDDFQASISVALLAIPQSIAYALLAGLPPIAGLFSAIFGVIIAGFFCSSRHLVAGPSTGVAILVQSTLSDILTTYYPSLPAEEVFSTTLCILAEMTLLIGILQIVSGFLRLGKLLQFVSRSVILGYFAGVIIAIVINQLYYLLGIPDQNKASTALFKLGYFIAHLPTLNLPSLFLGLLGLALLLLMKKYLKKWPSTLLMLLFMSAFAYFLNKGFENIPFFNQQEKDFHILTLGEMGLVSKPALQFSFSFFDLNLINKIFSSSLAIALLSILEVFSISRTLAAKSGQTTQANQEIFSVGVANTFLSFLVGAMPTSGSVSRSSLNFFQKGRTRFSAIFSGIFVGLFTFFFWPFIKQIPLTALAALLLVLAPSLINKEDIRLVFRATRGDALVFILTMASCLIFSLDIAFFIGIVISIASYLRKASEPHLVEYAFNQAGRLMVVSDTEEVKRKIRIIGVAGELFFAALDLLESTLQKIADDPYVKGVVLRLNGVHYIDASTCFTLLRLHDYLMVRNRHLILSGVSEDVWQTLYQAKLVDKLGQNNLFLADETRPQLSTWRACVRIEELIYGSSA